MKNKLLPAIIAFSYFLLTVYLLTLPGSQFPKITWMDKIPLFDKWVHIGLFAVLTFLWCRVVSNALVKHFILVATICLLYGIAIEFIQGNYILFRGFEGGDILADAAGCIIGYWVSKKWLLKKTQSA